MRIIVLLMVLGLAGNERTAAAQSIDRLAIVVYLHDDLQIPRDVIARAQRETVRIYADAGVNIIWTRDYSAPHPLTMKVCSNALPGKKINRNALGGAPGTKEMRGFLAYAFYRRIEEVGMPNRADLATLLGHVMAHEIGHLLLPFDSHSSTGIMRGEWDRAQLDAARRHTLSFTTEQAQLMRARLADDERLAANTQPGPTFEEVVR